MNYLDDVSIVSKGTDHVDDLARVLKRLARWGITMKLPKCTFATKTLPFLGFVVRAGEGVAVDASKVAAIVKLTPPKTVTAVKGFIGACSFLRKFLPDFASLTAPLQDVIKGKKKRENIEEAWRADPRCDASFCAIKAALVSAPVLAFPDFSRQFNIAVDASGGQLGACLFQVGPDNCMRPVAYASRRLSDCETRYGISDLECLGIVWACRIFRKYIHGSETNVLCDHSALECLVGPKAKLNLSG